MATDRCCYRCSYSAYFTDQLQTLPKGTTLWHVSAKDTPGAHPVHIGDVVTTSEFTTSDYGDSKLFLKHQKFEEDLQLRAEWLRECPTEDDCPVCPVEVSCWD